MNDYFDKAFNYGTMRKALNRCCRGVRWKDSIVGYELHAPQNTHKLLDQIWNGKYKIQPYQRFTIHEPKVREIVATRIADRQIQMAMCIGGLYEDLTEHFIHDNCACQIGKGTDFALNRMKVHLRRYYNKHGRDGWVLKCDVHHFFPSTKHEVAKAAVAKRVGDERIRKMIFDVIDSFGGDTGIGLGSQISQLMELAVLDGMDHFIKERLRIERYVRYMDDFILIHHDKQYLKHCWKEIEKYLESIGLELNRKTTVYPLRNGVKFLQWRFIITTTGRIVMKMDGGKMGHERRRLRKLVQKELNGEVPSGTVYNSFISWKANADRGDEFFRIKRMQQFYETLKGEIDNGNDTGKASETGTRCLVGKLAGGEQSGKYRLSGHDVRHRNSY